MAGNGGSGTGLGDVRNLLGFLVAGFAGVLNVLGLKSAEIGVVLRNDPVEAGIVAGFLLLAVLAAVVSVFVNVNWHPISVPTAVIVLLFAAATFPLMVWFVPAPFEGHQNEHVASIVVASALAGTALLMGIGYGAWCLGRWWYRRHGQGAQPDPPENQNRRWCADVLNLQCLLLAVAVILTSTAAYGAMRVETNSQTSSVAQIGDTLQMSGQRATLAVAVSASKLTMTDWLSVNVQAVPSNWKLPKLCHSAAATRLRTKYSVQCVQDPCFYAANVDGHAHCKELSEDVLAPDSTGSVLRTIDVLFAARKFQHVQVTAQTCSPRVGKPQGRCQRTGAVSRLEIAVPGRRGR